MTRPLYEAGLIDDEPVLKVCVDSRANLEAVLEAGVTLLRHRTGFLSGDSGVLVTRHSACDFTLEVHPDVP